MVTCQLNTRTRIKRADGMVWWDGYAWAGLNNTTSAGQSYLTQWLCNGHGALKLTDQILNIRLF